MYNPRQYQPNSDFENSFQFIVQAALKEAHKILEEERVIVLSERDADKVFGLLENPPAPNARLQEAARKHKAFFREGR